MLPFNTVTKRFENCGSQFNVNFVYKSGPNLASLLGSTKDKVDKANGSGIYQMVMHSTDNRFMLDALESIEIHRCKPGINDKPPPIVSPLFSLL